MDVADDPGGDLDTAGYPRSAAGMTAFVPTVGVGWGIVVMTPRNHLWHEVCGVWNVACGCAACGMLDRVTSRRRARP